MLHGVAFDGERNVIDIDTCDPSIVPVRVPSLEVVPNVPASV